MAGKATGNEKAGSGKNEKGKQIEFVRPRMVRFHIESMSPYSQSAPLQSERKNEDFREFEARTWREHIHADDRGVYIPATAIKNCLSEAAKFLSMSVPGKGKATYTKNFEAGIMCSTNVHLGIKPEDVAGEWLFLPSDGKRGGGSRVWKCYPVIPAWSGDVECVVLDGMITPEVFEAHLKAAGMFIGVGRFRPRNNGFYGRWQAKDIQWTDL